MLWAAASLLLAGCSSAADEPAVSGGDAAVIRAGFSITVSDTSGAQAASPSASRAPGYLGEGYDKGEGYENYIDIAGGNFRFYFFGDDDRLIAPMRVEAVLPTGATATSKTYWVSGDTRADIRGARVKVLALVNWPVYPDDASLRPGVTTIADLCAGEYAYDAAAMMPSADRLIPLFGIGALTELEFDINHNARLGTIHLLRAMAKVEVRLHPDCPIAIEWARIRRYNSRGCCAPAGVTAESDYVHGNYRDDYVATPTVPSGCETDGDVELVPSADGTSLVGYVPEYRNLAAGGVARPEGERSVVMVRFKEDPDRDYDVVEFKDYAGSGAHFDILRNYWYRFTVSKSLTPMVQMVPYNEVDLDPGFGLIVGPNYVPVLDSDGKIVYWYDPDTGKYYGTDKLTEVADPYISVDPVTGWSLVRDLNNRFFCYHDNVDDVFYATDKMTRIKNPFELTEHITVKQDGKDVAVDCNKIVDADTDKLYYYYDRASSVWYTPDKTPLAADQTPFYSR